MSQPVVRRPNLPLTEKDEADLEVLRTSPQHRAVLAQLSGISAEGDVGEGVLLHAVFEAGMAAVQASALERGYAQLAAEYAKSSASRRRMSRRRNPAWAEEA